MPGGRPRKEIKKENFEKLCGLMCTEAEICGFFGITEKTLTRWCKETYHQSFSQAFKTYSQDGKIALRRAQFRLAEKSPAMAIFLGKQYLDQRDNLDMSINSEGKSEEVRALDAYFERRKQEADS